MSATDSVRRDDDVSNAEPVPFGSQIYGEIVDFLYREAELLDEGRLNEWLTLLTPDIAYRMPVQLTRRKGREPSTSEPSHIFDEDLVSLRVRVARLDTKFAWAEDPPSRMRHFVTNVRVRKTPNDNEVAARSNFLMYRTRGDQLTGDLLCGERRDLLRLDPEWRLARRELRLDQSVPMIRHISMFL